jgi:hypothetical protein
VFPEFVETCRDHIKAQPKLDEKQFEAFEKKCLKRDAVALVEYALALEARGCTIDLTGSTKPSTGRRLQSGSAATMSSMFDSDSRTCQWDDIDNYAREVDLVCCGGKGCIGGHLPSKCSPGCALTYHQFLKNCGPTMKVIIPNTQDKRVKSIMAFDHQCVSKQDPKFFEEAIRNAKCPNHK